MIMRKEKYDEEPPNIKRIICLVFSWVTLCLAKFNKLTNGKFQYQSYLISFGPEKKSADTCRMQIFFISSKVVPKSFLNVVPNSLKLIKLKNNTAKSIKLPEKPLHVFKCTLHSWIDVFCFWLFSKLKEYPISVGID